ncbi:MAG: tetratricopeptide repeat protein [Thermodesulfobacteriota bacterium]
MINSVGEDPIDIRQPEKAVDYYKAGCRALQGQDWTEAVRTLTLAARFGRGWSRPYSARGRAHAEQGQYQQAVADCNQAILIDPQDSHAYNNRGLVFQRTGDLFQAKRDYARACDLGLKTGCRNLDGLRVEPSELGGLLKPHAP